MKFYNLGNRFVSSQGFWESTNCGVHQDFICKRSGSVEVNSTAAPTEPPKGGCAPDWVKFQTKVNDIYIKHMVSHNSNDNWTKDIVQHNYIRLIHYSYRSECRGIILKA